jgi:hypothetical protein
MVNIILKYFLKRGELYVTKTILFWMDEQQEQKAIK